VTVLEMFIYMTERKLRVKFVAQKVVLTFEQFFYYSAIHYHYHHYLIIYLFA